MSSIDPEQPEFGLPAEVVFAALLEAQSPVPVEKQPSTNGAWPTAAPLAAPAPEIPVPSNAVQLKGPALKLAQNMDASLATPTATTFRELPVRTLEARRAELNAALNAAGRTEKL